MRPYFLLLLSLAMVSCVDGGTGGYAPPPEAAAWSAYGTATAAVVQVTGTAVSQQATYTAVYAQATATAQAVSVQATSAAAPTVTAQAEYESVLAQGQATQDAIKADVMRAEATATAVRLTELMAWERAQTVKRAQSAEFWYWVRWAVLGLIVLAGVLGIPRLVNAAYYRWLPPPEAVYDEDGRTAAVHRSYQQVTRPYTAQAQTTRPEPPQPVFVPTSTNSQRRGTLPPLNGVTRANLNNWLKAIYSGTAGLNRTSADTYGIGHEVTDSIIQMALDGGYAAKGQNRNDPVYALDNFGKFVDLIAISPYTNMHPPTPANVYPVNGSPDGANGSPGEAFAR